MANYLKKNSCFKEGERHIVKKIKMDKSAPSGSTDLNIHENSIDMNAKDGSPERITWRGSSLLHFARLSSDNMNVPPVDLSPDHEVYVKLPLTRNKPPDPYPGTYQDFWNSKFVRMPNSPESLYPIRMVGDKSKVVKRWAVIQDAYKEKITCVQSLRKAILSYNQRYENRWIFAGLEYLMEKEFLPEEKDFFFDNVLPKIIELALDLPNIIARPPILLTRKCTKSISLSQKQIACLLANAFLCTFPRRNAKGTQTEYANYPDINFNRLFFHVEQRVLEKLKCVVHYFKEVTSRASVCGVVTFTRQFIRPDDLPDFEGCTAPLGRLHVDSRGLIEKATGMLQVDFANKYIGGGVLGKGCVQEEIRFMLCPELLVSRLFTEVLDRTEVLVITGVEQYNKCQGYASNFEWVAPFIDQTPMDMFNRRLCQVVALDALHFSSNPSIQYKQSLVLRELHKAYVGFKPLDRSKGQPVSIATGNWGCGAFNGDPRLKALIQVAAASAVGRDVAYFTFGNKSLRDDLADIHQALKDKDVTVGQLVFTLCQYEKQTSSPDGRNLFTFVSRTLTDFFSDTDSEEASQEKEEISSHKVDATPNEHKKAAASRITDYFKPMAKSTSGNMKDPALSFMKTEVVERGLSLTETKIMQALTECDKLVKETLMVKGNGIDASTTTKPLKRERENENRPSSRLVQDSSPCVSTKDFRSSSPHSPTSLPSLFDCLDKIDRTLKQ